jgi:hypothetical protein
MMFPKPGSVMSVSQGHCDPIIWQFFNTVRADRLGLKPIQNSLTMFR